jgi:hypothetical protein
VEGEIAREDIEAQILQLPAVGAESAVASADGNPGSGKEKRRITVSGNGVSFSNMIGNGACNRKYFAARYPDLSIRFAVDDSLPDMTFTVRES